MRSLVSSSAAHPSYISLHTLICVQERVPIPLPLSLRPTTALSDKLRRRPNPIECPPPLENICHGGQKMFARKRTSERLGCDIMKANTAFVASYLDLNPEVAVSRVGKASEAQIRHRPRLRHHESENRYRMRARGTLSYGIGGFSRRTCHVCA